MKFTHALIGVFAILFLSACSSSTSSVAKSDAAPQKAASTTEVAVGAEPDNGYRCKRVAVTGTRFTEKYCTTAQQREATAAAAATAAAQISRRATQAGGPRAN